LLQALRAEVEGGAAHGQAAQPDAIEELSAADLAPVELSTATPAAVTPAPEAQPELVVAVEPAIEAAPEIEISPAVETVAAGHASGGQFDDFVQDLDSSLGNQFLAVPPAEAVAVPETVQPEAALHALPEIELAPSESELPREAIPQPAIVSRTEPASALGDFVADLEASLGDGFLPAAAVQPPAAPSVPRFEARPEIAAETSTVVPSAMAAAAPSASSHPASISYLPPPDPVTEQGGADIAPLKVAAGIDLADMFGELKQELEEDASSSGEDPETHYNLGVAFREMGLLDEAIGELQKVCQSIDRGQAFSQTMQTYTWLAQCFLDKGIPEAAIRWYEQALKLPKLDQETRTALHYEIGGAYENAGNKASALSNFMQVYGNNIDYRDVAERIQALRS
jgi:hypothetical protein